MMTYEQGKRTLDALNAKRDAIYQERAILRKNAELSRADRTYIYERLTEQLVELIAMRNEAARKLTFLERDKNYNVLSGSRNAQYRYS